MHARNRPRTPSPAESSAIKTIATERGLHHVFQLSRRHLEGLVDAQDDIPDHGGPSGGGDARFRPHDDSAPESRRGRVVDDIALRLAEALQLSVLDGADYGDITRAPCDAKCQTHWIATIEESVGEPTIHDRDLRRRRTVALVEISSPEQLNPNRSKILRRSRDHEHGRWLVRLRSIAGHFCRCPPGQAANRQSGYCARAADLRRIVQPLQNVREHSRCSWRLVLMQPGDVGVHHTAPVESTGFRIQLRERAGEKAGPGDQKERDRDLHDDDGPRKPSTASTDRAPCRAREHGVQGHP